MFFARYLINLYAQRCNEKGFAFSHDTFMQHELEASFIYEDTPDKLKSTAEVKADMERDRPMDRLICGDVGFGKTEIAIRAAFNAESDNKQLAVQDKIFHEIELLLAMYDLKYITNN